MLCFEMVSIGFGRGEERGGGEGECLRCRVRAKEGLLRVFGSERSGAGVVRQVNSEGYIVVRRVSSAA